MYHDKPEAPMMMPLTGYFTLMVHSPGDPCYNNMGQD